MSCQAENTNRLHKPLPAIAPAMSSHVETPGSPQTPSSSVRPAYENDQWAGNGADAASFGTKRERRTSHVKSSERTTGGERFLSMLSPKGSTNGHNGFGRKPSRQDITMEDDAGGESGGNMLLRKMSSSLHSRKSRGAEKAQSPSYGPQV